MEGVETPLKAWKSNKTGNMLRVQEVQSSNPGGPINQFRPWFYCSALSHRPVRGAGRPCEKCERIGQLGRESHLWPTQLSRLTSLSMIRDVPEAIPQVDAGGCESRPLSGDGRVSE